MKIKRLSANQQYHIDLELIKSKPANRTEAKAQLAAKLRIEKFREKLRPVGTKYARQSLERANAIRFDEGKVESIDTVRIADCYKRWRGKSAD